DVRLDFDDDAARADAPAVVHEDFPNQIARDVERGPVVERARQFHVRQDVVSAFRRTLERPAKAGHYGRDYRPDASAVDRPSASTVRKYRPVCDVSICATCSGVPVATTRPPDSPPSGPRSMM